MRIRTCELVICFPVSFRLKKTQVFQHLRTLPPGIGLLFHWVCVMHTYSVSCFYDHHYFNTNNFVIYIPTVWFSISLYVQNMTCFILDDVCFARFKMYILCEWWQKQINLFYKNHFCFCWVFFLEASDKKRWEKHCLSLKSILNLIIPVVFYRHQLKNWIPVAKTLKTKIYLCWDQLNRETRFTFITSWEQLGQYHFNELEASWSLGLSNLTKWRARLSSNWR